MKDLKFDDSNRKEVIDGVTVVHTGMIQYTNGINIHLYYHLINISTVLIFYFYNNKISNCIFFFLPL